MLIIFCFFYRILAFSFLFDLLKSCKLVNLQLVFWIEDARLENGEQPAVPAYKKQEVLRLLHFHASNRTDRSAIRSHGSQNEIDISKRYHLPQNVTFRYTSELNTLLFFHTLHGSSM